MDMTWLDFQLSTENQNDRQLTTNIFFNLIFLPPRACGRRHYVVGLSIRLSVRPDSIFFSNGEWDGKGGKANLICCQGGCGEFKTNLNGFYFFSNGGWDGKGGKANLICCQGGCGGFKTNLNKKVRDPGDFFFIYNLCPYLFSNGKVRQERRMIQARLGTWGVLTNIYFKSFFSLNAVASLDYISLQTGIVRPGGKGSKPIWLFFCLGGRFKTNLNKKVGGPGQNNFFCL